VLLRYGWHLGLPFLEIGTFRASPAQFPYCASLLKPYRELTQVPELHSVSDGACRVLMGLSCQKVNI